MGLNVVKQDTNKPTWGRRPKEYSRKTPNLAMKKEIEGHSCLMKSKSIIK